jgi:hypothetical protein
MAALIQVKADAPTSGIERLRARLTAISDRWAKLTRKNQKWKALAQPWQYLQTTTARKMR